MADVARPAEPTEPSEAERSRPYTEPPPLLDVRIKGRRPKGLNKKAIVCVAAGGLIAVLMVASSGLSLDRSRAPAKARPLMSDPAMSSMAEARVRDLPADYGEAETFITRHQPVIPALGPPLPGEIAAFSAFEPMEDPYDRHPGWDDRRPIASAEPDPEESEAKEAARSGLFFEMRREGADAPAADETEASSSRRANALTALGPSLSRTGSDLALHPGSVITASLVTAIDSEAPGPVIAQVTHPVYDSASGRVVMIPQGARLLGEYAPGSRYGEKRLAILWSRLIMPDGEEILLHETAVDPAGSAGIEGKVDNHWGGVFGAAALGTLINIGVATTEDRPTVGLTFNGVGVLAEDPVDGAVRDGLQRSVAIVTNRLVDRAIATSPSIRIKAGVKVSVIVTRRLRL